MKARPEPKRRDVAHEREPDKRERLLKSGLSFEELTKKVLKKKPPADGWTDQQGEKEVKKPKR